MPWFKVDDRFHGSRKVKRIPKSTRLAAVGLWALAGSWSASEGLDGFIPDYMIEELGGNQKLTTALVEAGLWEPAPDGTVFHNWTKYNPDAASTSAMQGAKSEGGAHGNHLRWHVKRNLTVTGCQWCDSPSDRISESPTDQGSESGANPPGPPRSSPAPEGSKDPSSKARETKLSKDWAPTAEHIKRAKESGLSVLDEAENFRLHAETYDRRAANWNAAFTTWLKKARPKNVAPIKRVPTNSEYMYR